MNDEILSQFTYNPETGQLSRNGKTFTANGNEYIRLCINRRTVYAHRIIWHIMTGEPPKGDIDHIDRDKHNNRWNNLRDVTKSDNLRNAKIMNTNKTGVKWVHLSKTKWAYRVKSTIHGDFGGFDNIFDAAAAAISAQNKSGSIY